VRGLTKKMTEKPGQALTSTGIRAAPILNRGDVPANDATMHQDVELPDSGKK
jgi:hypothetical protein